ncbi:class I SAM-dependent methyltransferase [Streptomyces daliensis]|uniref:Class I SAM-dependent methyltransferase n=1 Tax=Streptomyces daliensis TaxID=299421 RepID=A0A8T4IN65_9ACTN|nr:class I SAM-dependent methyltransferase [Streptomyces daliensis]
MPTIPPGRPAPSGSDSSFRQYAESFGTDAERYERARPRYPEALLERVIASSPSPSPGSGPGPDILDVGCGTGIAARQFQALGGRVLGVEPDARMAEVARRFGVEVETAAFEGWDAGGREFDVVVAGQAWHWIDPVAGAAKAAEVLRPGGLLAAFWNVFRLPPELADACGDAYRRAVPDSPFDLRAALSQDTDPYQEILTRAADGIQRTGAFGAAERWRFDWEHLCTKDAWLDQLPTLGILTRLPPDQLAPVLEAAGDAVDAAGGSFTMRYATVAVGASRTGAAT